MSIRLGNGEFELKKATVRRSTLDGRLKFFEAIESDRMDVFKQIFRWGNIQFLLPDLNWRAMSFSELMSVSTDALEPQDRDRFLDTPVNNYISFICSKAKELCSVEMKIEEEYAGFPDHIISSKEEALNQFLPNFNSLRTFPDAARLVNSLQVWGAKVNLTAEWCWDFALTLLHKFKLHVLDQLDIEDISKIRAENLDWVYAEINSSVELFVMQAGSDFNQMKLVFEGTETRSDLEAKTAPFEFRWKDFTLLDRWYFFSETRRNFEDRMNRDFDARYSQLSREALSLYLGTKSRFLRALRNHCQQVTKQIKPFVIKTPRLNTGNKYFEWLVAYQLDATKGFSRIARENGVNVKTVSEAIRQIAKIIDLPLRSPTPPGRLRKAHQN